MRITIRSLYFEYAIAELKDGNIERAAAKVEYEDSLIAIFIKAISKCCSRRLVDNTQNIEACDLPGVFRCLALAVVEVRWYCDDCLRNRLTKISLCISLKFLQDHR